MLDFKYFYSFFLRKDGSEYFLLHFIQYLLSIGIESFYCCKVNYITLSPQRRCGGPVVKPQTEVYTANVAFDSSHRHLLQAISCLHVTFFPNRIQSPTLVYMNTN